MTTARPPFDVAPGRIPTPLVGGPQLAAATNDNASSQRWLVQIGDGAFQLIENERELAELLRLGRLKETTPAYAVADGPRLLRDVADVAGLMSAAVAPEGAVRHEGRSPEREKLSAELAVLNLPLEDEITYFDEPPVRRWPKRVALATALAAAVIGAALFAVPRLSSSQPLAMVRLIQPASASPAGPKTESTPSPTAPVAPPSAPSDSPATPSPVANAAGAPDPVPPVKTAEAHKVAHSSRRHPSGAHATHRSGSRGERKTRAASALTR